jgi:hypothetical protein
MASVIPIKLTPRILLALAVLILGVGFGFGKYLGGRSLRETFQGSVCNTCSERKVVCKCPKAEEPKKEEPKPIDYTQFTCPPCQQPDMSKYVLKATVPPCPTAPDLSKYMLKTECPPVPDLSKYVLKSSIPKQQPVIIDNSSCNKEAGECPPCPRTRCPEVKCPPPTVCPPVSDCPRQVCPPTTVKCKAEGTNDSEVRPFLAPLSMSTFGEGFSNYRRKMKFKSRQ